MWNRSHLPYVNSNGKNNVDRYSFFRTQVDLSSCQVSYTNVLHIVNVFYSDNFYKNYSTADEKNRWKKDTFATYIENNPSNKTNMR